MATGRRNGALIAAAHGALVVWDGVETDLGATVAMLERRSPDEVWGNQPDVNHALALLVAAPRRDCLSL